MVRFATLSIPADTHAEGDVDLLAFDEHWDPHAIAGLLKAYLRELPTSLLTRELHLHFIATMGES
jgi:RalA-binding protein 1